MATSLTGVFGDSAPIVVSAADHHAAVRLPDRIALVAAERPARTVRDEQYVYTEIKGSGRGRRGHGRLRP